MEIKITMNNSSTKVMSKASDENSNDLVKGGVLSITKFLAGWFSYSFLEEWKKPETKSKAKLSWQTYVDDHLVCTIEGSSRRLSSSAIIGHEGHVWAKSSRFPKLKSGEISGIMNGFDEPGFFGKEDIYLGGSRYFLLRRKTGEMIHLIWGGSHGVIVKKTKLGLIFGIYDEPVSPRQCNLVLERISDHLVAHDI